MNFGDKEECFLLILFMVLTVNCLFVLLLFVWFFLVFFPLLRCMCSSINIENSAKL